MARRTLRNLARERREAKRLASSLNSRYAENLPSLRASVAGRDLVTIDGQKVQAQGVNGRGGNVEVVNVGRAAAAIYAPAQRTQVIATGGGSGGGGSGGGGNGGSTYTAGDGIAIDALNVISVNTPAIIDPLRGLSIVAGNIGVSLASPSGLLFGAGGALQVADSLAGAGLKIANKIMDIDLEAASGLSTATGKLKADLGRGLELAGNALEVNEAFAFTWTGVHTFQADPQINANLDFIGGPRLITSAYDLTIDPAANFYLDANVNFTGGARSITTTGASDITIAPGTGGDLVVNANLEFGGARRITTTPTNNLTLAPTGDLYLDNLPDFLTENFIDSPIKIAGFRLFPLSGDRRQLTIGVLKADEMHVRVFVADETRVSRAETLLSYSYGFLANNAPDPSTDSIGFVIPMGTVYPYTLSGLTFEDSPALVGQIFVAGDWIEFVIVDLQQNGKSTIARVRGTVAGYVDNGDGTQNWNFTIVYGPDTTTQAFEVKAGAFCTDFGKSGQSFIHETVLEESGGPFMSIQSWTGTNPVDGVVVEHVRVGKLDSVSDPTFVFKTNDYGLYADNAYLRGILRTPNTLIDHDAISIFVPEGTPEGSNQFAITFEDDVNHYIYGGLYAWHDTTPDNFRFLRLRVADDPNYLGRAVMDIAAESIYGNDARIEITASVGGGAWKNSLLWLYSGAFMGNSYARLESEEIHLRTWISSGVEGDLYGVVSVESPLHPRADLAFDLGTANLRWRNLYVNEIFVSGSISGETLAGAEWEHIGTAMIIDANNAVDSLVTITNQGTGRADLSVDRNITLGGTIDGVDVSNLQGNFDSHEADLVAHHSPASALAGGGIVVAANQVLSVDTTVVRTTRTLTAGDGLDGGGDLSANRTFAVDSTVVRTSRVITAGSGLTGGGALSANITLNVGQGDGITVGADTVAVDGTVVRITRILTAGSGLSGGGDLSANRTFTVGQGQGIQVNATDIAVRLHATSGLQFTTGGNLQLGSPGTLTVGSINELVGASHWHDVDSTSDAATEPGKILHATPGTPPAGGGLILRTLQVRGNVSITDNGDLDVANHTLFVDATKNSVGIGGIPLDNPDFPDAQFALDINGPARAQYWIGPHAIQLKDVLLLSHFDGKEPFNTNTSGEPNSMMGQVGVPSTTAGVSNLVFRPGKFFKALEITRGATNLLSNPQFDGGSTSGWSDIVTGAATGTRAALATRETYIGAYSYRLVKTGGAALDRWGTVTTFAATSGLAYTVSVWINAQAMTGNRTILLDLRGSAFAASNVSYQVPETGDTDGWVRLQLTATATATGTGELGVWIHDAPSGVLYLSAVMATATAYAHPYTAASRSATSLSYPNLASNWARLTMMAWIYPSTSANSIGTAQRVLVLHKDASNYYYLIVNTSNQLQLSNAGGVVVTSSATVPGNAWTHVAVTVGGGTATLYINGVADGSAAIATVPSGTLPTLYVGCSEGLVAQLNGLLDDLVVVDRTLEAEEILSVYESNAPVFAESVRYSARFTQKGLGWFDDEGFWLNDSLGNAVLGVYGGEAATKSWGGRTDMAAGDIQFGVYGASGSGAPGGWLYFDRDGSGSTGLLKLGYGVQDVFTVSSTAAKLQGVNLELYSGANEFLGVFATTPPTAWAGNTNAAIGDVIIGDYGRGAALWWDDSAGAVYIGAAANYSGSAGANGNWISAGPGALSIGRGTTTRIRIDGSGNLTINNSAGSAVYTFSSTGGAEFTLPLTLGTGGGIYQGTGTFATAATTGIGLKIFNSGGIGKLSTYNTGVEQITLDTDGRFKAGGGVVRLDQLGISVEANISDSINPLHAYVFRDANGVEYGGLYSHLFPDINGARNLKVSLPQESRPAFIRMEALSSVGADLTLFSQVGSNYSAVELTVNPTPLLSLRSIGVINLASASEIRMVNDSTVTSALTGGGVVQITQKSTSGAVPVLAMNQLDLSEEFFAFVGTVAAGYPIEAKGIKNLTTTHFVRVSVNGTPYYMAVGTIA